MKNKILSLLLILYTDYTYIISQQPALQQEILEENQNINIQNLVPDDIANPTKWRLLNIEEIQPLGFTDSLKIRTRHLYVPDMCDNDEALVVFITVHGTASEESHAFFKDLPDNDTPVLESQNYRHIKRTSSWYSTVKRKKLEALSLLWSGNLFNDGREAAAGFLYQLFNENKRYLEAEVVLLGHSHGCNVINRFSQRSLGLNIQPLVLIYFGCPQLADRDPGYRPANYKMLLYFYSDSDWITVGGRDDKKAVAIITGGVIVVGALFLGAGGIVVVKLLPGAIGAGAKAIVGLKALAAGTLGASVGVVATEQVFSYCLDGRNDFDPIDNSISVGYRLKFDGRNPNHNEITNIAEYLPKIIEKTQRYFKSHMLDSSKFHLNVDTIDNAHPINLVIFERDNVGRNILIPESLENLILEYEQADQALANNQPTERVLRFENIGRREHNEGIMQSRLDAQDYQNRHHRAIETNILRDGAIF